MPVVSRQTKFLISFVRKQLRHFIRPEKPERLPTEWDIAFCVLNKDRKKLQYSVHSTRSLLSRVVNSGNTKATECQSGYITARKVPFTNYLINVSKVILYIFSRMVLPHSSEDRKVPNTKNQNSGTFFRKSITARWLNKEYP